MNTQVTSQATRYPLITRERTEKLELLNHLITNLANAIIICGPEGVGKTTLITYFQKARTESRIFCRLQGDSQVNLESIQALLMETLAQEMPNSKLNILANAFNRLVGSDIKIILIIDDAGQLAPGLIEKIILFVNDIPVLRVIFVLTHSELYLKNGTDPVVDDCYQIEIPPLTEKQCSDFLEYLSTIANPRIQFSAINESMVSAIYRETHGIPGNILTHLPAPENHKVIDYSKTILTFAVIGLIIVAFGVQIWSSKQKTGEDSSVVANQSEADKLLLEQQKLYDKLEADKSFAGNSKGTSPNPDQVNLAQGLKRDHIGLQMPKSISSDGSVDSSKINDMPQKSDEVNLPANTVVAHDESSAWLKAQPIENYTLQLMALSKQQPIIDVLQRYQGLGLNLVYLNTKMRNGRDRFVLIYGSFVSPEQASIEKQKLPKELQKTWLRKIDAIQKEIEIKTPADKATQTGMPE